MHAYTYIYMYRHLTFGLLTKFFMERVGQYIADIVKLMTNLQTIAESLNTLCRCRAWFLELQESFLADEHARIGQRYREEFDRYMGDDATREAFFTMQA